MSSPQHHGQIERRVEPYNRAIAGAMAAGVIKCRRTLEVVLASALITQTQLMVTYGTTAFTRRTGAVPRTHRELYSSANEGNIALEASTLEDAAVLTALTFYVTELCDWHQEMRDMAHRKSLYPKLSAIAKQQGTDFYLVVGDMVSYNGEKWLLLEITGSPNQPMTAQIQQATHADAVAIKVVRYDTLRPLASMREKLRYEPESTVCKGDFIFFLQDKKIDGQLQSLVVPGKVTSIEHDTYKVHVYDPSKQHKCYMPAWECKGKADRNHKTCPKGYTPEIMDVQHSDLEMITKLTSSYRIPKQAWSAMKAKGVVLPLEYTEETIATVTEQPDKTKRKVSFDKSVTVSAVTVAKTKRRPDRRSRLTMQTGDRQHIWVTTMLRQRGLPVKDDAMLDHGRLLHNLIYDTNSAPSGAMMDENYANIRRTMGGPDTGNMVPQMQTFVCRQERDSVQQQQNTEQLQPDNTRQQQPTAPPWDDAAEAALWNELWEADADNDMMHASRARDAEARAHDNSNEAPIPTETNLKTWDSEMPDTQSDTGHDDMIQCTVTPPAHTTNTAVWGLAVVGGAAMTAAIAVVAVMCWLSLQGIHVTGFWLTLTPSDGNAGTGDDENALK